MVDIKAIEKHYSNPKVKEEIVKFAKNRWAAILCSKKNSQGTLFVRYLGKFKTPLKIDKEEDLDALLKRLEKWQPRSFYATANLYRSLRIREDVANINNIVACTPTWDIDNDLDDWSTTLEVVKEILNYLMENGVEKSVFVKWSGRGCHIHIHHEAISEELRKRFNPLDLGFAIVEYVNLKLQNRFFEISRKHSSGRLKVENNMDPQRVFTCPLSLHKELDKVCVCIDVDKLDQFTPEWTDLKRFKHFGGWTRYVDGEADELAIKAIDSVGPCPARPRLRRRRHKPLDKHINEWLKKFEAIQREE